MYVRRMFTRFSLCTCNKFSMHLLIYPSLISTYRFVTTMDIFYDNGR